MSYRSKCLPGATLILLSVCTAAIDAAGAAQRWSLTDSGVLADSMTGLAWTRSDNGADVDWNDATAFCRRKGHRWRLPSLHELETLYEPAAPGIRCAATVCRISPLFELTGAWFWSATQVGKDATDGDGSAWGLLLANGVATQTVRDAAHGSRALCVRTPR